MSSQRPGWDRPLRTWFAARGWKPAPFQRESWRRYLDGESGLLHTPTGSGKTLAAFGGPLLQALNDPAAASAATGQGPSLLWITPLRALAADTSSHLAQTVREFGLDWVVAVRTGDASTRDKRLARQGKANVLVITPESLALLLSYADAGSRFSALRGIVVDEWHELLGNKRGVLLQLCLARLRRLSPGACTWGLSATLGNLQQALAVLLPTAHPGALVAAVPPRKVSISSLLPLADRHLPWSGHLGLSQLRQVLEHVFQARSSLLFTNTRAQAELWHRALASIWPEPPSTLALHHGSLSQPLRSTVEQGLREGRLRCVVATSSLDLGVDFPTVDQVFQIGSPKGVARLMQRAGRSRHRPGTSGHVICVATQALELIEYAAARQAIVDGVIESQAPLRGCLDVLAQHAVTLAVGGGFRAEALFDEIRETYAYAELNADTWRAVLNFIERGGNALENYPQFCRVAADEQGRYRVHNRRIALHHRLSIGTISGDGAISVQYLRGGALGSVAEAFVARLRPGERFHFAGRTLQLVRLQGMTAYVRRAKAADGAVATWQGSRLALSNCLGREVEALFAAPGRHPEMRVSAPLLRIQQQASALPAPDRLLIEQIRTRRGQHLFLFPFAGRAVHEGLAAIMALRWGRSQPNTFSYTVNDYGLMLTLAMPAELDPALLRQLLSPAQVTADLRAGVNLGELARRHFREIARVAGLLIPSMPGREVRALRQIQASSGLLFDVLKRYDPDHILLAETEREVLQQQLQASRLQTVLQDCETRTTVIYQPRALTPLSFPLWSESLRGQLSTETWQVRVQRAAQQLQERYAKLR